MKNYIFILTIALCCFLPGCRWGKEKSKKTTKTVEKEVAVNEACINETPPKAVADLDFQDLEDLSSEK